MPFDPSEILNTPVGAALSTDYLNVPEGVYPAVSLQDITGTPNTNRDGDETIILNIPWEISDPTVAEATGRKTSICKQGIFLDLDANGRISEASGANVKLGKLLAAIGLNEPGWKPTDLGGKPARVTIKHTKKGDDIFANVSAVEPF